jgi:hypothetical protein
MNFLCKVWCDWLRSNSDTWAPVATEKLFAQLSQLAAHLERLRLLVRPVTDAFVTEEHYLAASDKAEFAPVRLPEDAMLRGFGSDRSAAADRRRYCPRSAATTRLAEDACRLDAIDRCMDFLAGLEPPVLKRGVKTRPPPARTSRRGWRASPPNLTVIHEHE